MVIRVDCTLDKDKSHATTLSHKRFLRFHKRYEKMGNDGLDEKKKVRTRSLSPEGHENHQTEVVDGKRVVKHLRRVTKHGEMFRAHMSESLEQNVTEADLQTTKAVFENLNKHVSSEPPVVKAPQSGSFGCLQCGARIPNDTMRCPGCGQLYVQDPKGQAMDADSIGDGSLSNDEESLGVIERREIAFACFDATSGTVTCLKTDAEDPDFGLECHFCGAITQFGTDACPLCRHRFDEWDTGLIGILDGLKFDLDDDQELNCPACGEHVVVQGGKCPSCHETLQYMIRTSHDAGVLPILKEKGVVFVHLNAEAGELWFAMKLMPKKPGESETIHLDSINKVGFDQDWHSLSRI